MHAGDALIVAAACKRERGTVPGVDSIRYQRTLPNRSWVKCSHHSAEPIKVRQIATLPLPQSYYSFLQFPFVTMLRSFCYNGDIRERNVGFLFPHSKWNRPIQRFWNEKCLWWVPIHRR